VAGTFGSGVLCPSEISSDQAWVVDGGCRNRTEDQIRQALATKYGAARISFMDPVHWTAWTTVNSQASRWFSLLGACAAQPTVPGDGEESADSVSLAALNRFGYSKNESHYVHPSGHTLNFVTTTFFPISASLIRRKLAAHQSIRYLLPADVADYIERHGLYWAPYHPEKTPPANPCRSACGASRGSCPVLVDSLKKAIAAAEAALEKKAYDLVVLQVEHLSSIADYFLIATGRSDVQVQAIARGIEERMAHENQRPLAIEGLTHGHWVVLDYGDVVIHVFFEPARDFYRLERNWTDARQVALPEPYRSQARDLTLRAMGWRLVPS
jgi:ribosome-associated protein